MGKKHPTPWYRIAATWFLCVLPVVLCLAGLTVLVLPCFIAILVCAIWLVCSKNKAGIINGIAALVVWAGLAYLLLYVMGEI